ncbi:hypothetical protein [Mycobacterium sp. 48b]|uniref:hypothetical protein n=1 Tax=Mycobacterium sp. 48b TaxID=3400426 RepID=UPI003AAF5167
MTHPSEQEWASISEHTRASNFPGDLLRIPPYPLILTLRTLVGSIGSVIASHTHYQWEPQTKWQAWLFTAETVAYAEASYAETNYDYDEDNERRTKPDAFDKPIAAAPVHAWVRPANALSALSVDAVHYVRRSRPFREPPPEFYPTSIKLAFSDGISTTISLAGALDDPGKLERWERFVATARSALSR